MSKILTKDVDVMEICGECYYYENKSRGGCVNPSQNTAREKVILFVKCAHCAAASPMNALEFGLV